MPSPPRPSSRRAARAGVAGPGGLRVLYGLGGARRAEAFVARAASLPDGRALWLTRSQQRRRDLEAAWLDRAQGGLRGLFATFPEWIHEIHDALPGRAPRLGDTERLLLIERLLVAEAAGRADHPFREPDRRPGLVDRFRQLVADLKQSGCRTAEDARRLVARMRRVGDGLSETLLEPVARVFGRYQEELARLGVVEGDQAFFVVRDAFPAILRARGPLDLLVLEGLYALNDVQRDLLAVLVGHAAESVVLCDGVFPRDAPSRGEPPPALGADAVHARDLAFYAGLGAVFERLDDDGADADVRAALGRFSERRAAPANPVGAAPRAAVRLASCRRHPSLAEELRAIARGVRAARDADAAAGRPARRVAVLLPSLEGVVPLAEEVFARYDLPLRPVDRTRVAASAPGRLLADLLDAVEGGLEREDVFRVLLSPLVDARAVASRQELRAFRRLARGGGLVGGGGVGSWKEALEALRDSHLREDAAQLEAIAGCGGGLADAVAEIEAEESSRPAALPWLDAGSARSRLEAAWRAARRRDDGGAAPGGAAPGAAAADELLELALADAEEAGGVRRTLDKWAEGQGDLRLLFEASPRLLERLATWEAMRAADDPIAAAEALIEVLRDLRVGGALVATTRRALADRAATPLWEAVLQRDLRALGQLGAVIGEVGRVLALEEEPADWVAFAAQVRDALRDAELAPPESSGRDDVLLLSRLDARQRTFDVLYLAGMTADAVPGRQRVNIFFTERERAAVGWRTHEDTVAEWRHLLALLSLAAPEVHVSFHGAAEDQPGAPVRDLAAAFGVVVAAGDPENRGAGPSASPLPVPCSARERVLAEAAGVPLREPGEAARRDPTAGWRRRRVHLRNAVARRERARRAAAEREAPPALSRFDGWVALAGAAPAPLAGRVLRMSPTALETYAACPWEAWATRLLRLEAVPGARAASGSVDPGERGHLLHRLLAEAVEAASLPLPGDRLLDWSARTREVERRARAAAAELLPAARRLVAGGIDRDDWLPEIEPFWEGVWERWMRGLAVGPAAPATAPEGSTAARLARSIDREQGLLPLMLRLLEDVFAGWWPCAVEAGIGVRQGSKAQLAPRAVEVALPGEDDDAPPLLLRGVIDRLDFAPAGGAVHAVVIDYKTGGVPHIDDILEGERFQLPLYLRAVAEVARRARGTVRPGGALYLGVSERIVTVSGFLAPALLEQLEARAAARPSDAEPDLSLAVEPVDDVGAFLDALLRNVARARAAAGRGLFPTAWTADAWCAQCDLRRACRRDLDAKRAWLRRHQDELAPLGFYVPEPLVLPDDE